MSAEDYANVYKIRFNTTKKRKKKEMKKNTLIKWNGAYDCFYFMDYNVKVENLSYS